MTLLRKTFTLALGEGAARVFGVIIYVVIARTLGVEGFGVFSFAMSISLLAMVGIDMGQNSHAGRMISRANGENTHLYLRMSINKVVLGVRVTGVASLIMWLLGIDPEIIASTALLMGWATMMNIVGGIRAVLRALDNMAADATIASLESALRAGMVVLAAALGAGAVGFSAAFLIEATIASVVAFAVVSRKVRLVPSKVEWNESGSFLRGALGVGLVSMATIGFYRVDQVFILPLAGPTESGLYGAAARIAFTATTAGVLIVFAAYPRLAAALSDRDLFLRHFSSAVRLSGVVGVSVAAAIALFAKPLMGLFFGPAYADAVVLLRILSIAVGVNALTLVANSASNALHRERRVLPRVLTLVVLVSVANLLLVPRFGAYASAWISAVGEVFLFASILQVSWDRLRPSPNTPAEETGC